MSEVIQNWTLDEMVLSLKNLGENNIAQSHFMTLSQTYKDLFAQESKTKWPKSRLSL